jgi:hypothetical protein
MALTLVKATTNYWLPTSPTSNVGPQSLTLANTAGNLLIAFASIITSTSTMSPSIAMPAMSVCDSVGNWWRLAGDTGNVPDVPLRTAIWVCDNAIAIPSTGWWSISAAGYVGEIDCVVAEFSGLPVGYTSTIDFTVPYTSLSATTITMSAIAQQADYCFVCALCQDNSINFPATPWISLPVPDRLVSAYASFAASNNVTASFTTTSGALTGAGILVGISQVSYPPWNGNPNFPVVRVEAAFSTTPGDFSQSILDGQWTDITENAISGGEVAGITVTRGRQYELSTPEAGEMTVLLNNLTGNFNPVWSGSQYYSNALNDNMSFQAGVRHWTGVNNAVLSQSSDYSYITGINAVATYSMLVIPDGITDSPGFESSKIIVLTRDISPDYTFSFWVYSPAGWAPGVIAIIEWLDIDQELVSTITGTTTVLLEATWTLVTTNLVTAPVNAVFAGISASFSGTPSSNTVFYVAEAAMAAGTAGVQTGLVKLQTPIRVSAFWDGQRFPIGYGYVERWPQTWPDLPQWGFSPMIATDIVGAANSINMPSAVQGEILADEPYACFPFSESYQTTSNTINGAESTATDANGLIVINTSRLNQRTASYLTGDVPVETGQTINFNGDSGTGMGVSSYDDFTTTPLRGSGAVYGPDYALPIIGQSNGMTFELWATVPSVENEDDGGQYSPLIQFFGQPYIASNGAANLSPGWVAAVGVYFPGLDDSGTTACFVQWSQSSDIVISNATFPLDTLCHLVLDIDSTGNMAVYLNGVGIAYSINLLTGPLTAVTFGAATYSVGTTHARWNYSLAYGTIYPNELGPTRYTAHYVSGNTGFAGDNIMQRFGRYQAWAQLNLNEAGPGGIVDAFQLSAAYSTSGNSFADALNTDAQSAGATWFGNANGNLVVLPRPAIYRLPVSMMLGDNAQRILNYNPDFFFGTTSWSASSGTISVTSTPPAGSPYLNAMLCVTDG